MPQSPNSGELQRPVIQARCAAPQYSAYLAGARLWERETNTGGTGRLTSLINRL